MGLDSVELVMELEETFGFELTDEEATNIVTVGQMYDCVLSKIDKDRIGEYCGTQIIFHSLRRALVSVLRVDRGSVKPKVLTEELIPRAHRRQIWQKLSEEMNFKMPSLRLSGSLRVLGWFLWLLIAVLGSSVLYEGNTWLLMALIIFYSWSYHYIFIRVTLPLAINLYDSCTTIGGLTKSILLYNIGQFFELNEKDIWHSVTQIISEQLGVNVDDLKPETNFVTDLNID